MTYRVLILVLLSSNFLLSQTIEFVAGVSKADFTVDDNPRFNNFSTADFGYNITFGISNIDFGMKLLEDITGRITIGLGSSSGEFRSSSGGNAGQTIFYAKTDKRTLDIGIYPLNTYLIKNIKLDLGLLYSKILSSQFIGSTSNNGAAAINSPDKVVHDNLLRKNQLGFSARLAYKIKISNSIYILPQYVYFLGIGGEFNGNRGGIYVQNHFLGIGFEKKLSHQK